MIILFLNLSHELFIVIFKVLLQVLTVSIGISLTFKTTLLLLLHLNFRVHHAGLASDKLFHYLFCITVTSEHSASVADHPFKLCNLAVQFFIIT